jgi:hypothetical protein
MYQYMHYGNGRNLGGIMVDQIFMRRPNYDLLLVVGFFVSAWTLWSSNSYKWFWKSLTVSQETGRVSESVLLRAVSDVPTEDIAFRVTYSEVLRTSYPLMHWNIPEGRIPQPHLCEYLRTPLCYRYKELSVIADSDDNYWTLQAWSCTLNTSALWSKCTAVLF